MRHVVSRVMGRRQKGRGHGRLGVQVGHPGGRQVAQVTHGQRRHVVPELVVRRRRGVGDRRDPGRRRAVGRAPLIVVVVVTTVVVVVGVDGVAGPVEPQQLLDREGRALRHLSVRSHRGECDATSRCLRQPASSAQVYDVHALIQDCRFRGDFLA